jgi:hypothetical protein
MRRVSFIPFLHSYLILSPRQSLVVGEMTIETIELLL